MANDWTSEARAGVERASASALTRSLAACLFIVGLVAVAPPAVRAAEVVPSVGLTRSVDSDETHSQIGLALRGRVVPGLIGTELGVGYRKAEYSDGALQLTQVPVTVSLLATPIPTLHGDAGVGWYNTRFEYRDPLLKDETKQKFGVHVGGGFKIPLAPGVAADLTGRYVFLERQESRLGPGTFNPDYWTLSLGLAFRL
jgi:hypothetical protein